MRLLAADTDLWTDATWIVDSTPVECGRSRSTVKRSELASWGKYGYCASHSRWFWGLRLHLVCTPAGLPIAWALADPKIDERKVLMAICDHEPHLLADRPPNCWASPTRATSPANWTASCTSAGPG